ARIHIEQSGYPLHVIHGYTMKGGEVEDLSQLIGRQSLRSLGRMRGVTRRRLETLPAAALVLARVVAALRYKEVVFSAYGLREGHVFSLLPDKEKTEDPLLAAAAEIAAREARFDDLGAALVDWTAPLFPGESPAERRLRTAACRLSDIAWREHPDYRAPQALSRILYFPFSGVSHADRVYMAYSAFVRYGGALKASAVKPYLHLLDDEQVQSPRVLGLAQRLAYRVSGATRAVLARCELSYDGTTLRLRLPDDGSAPGGEAVERRFQALAETLGAKKAVMEG
ncbi:MAG TPA: Ppx/GppA family phosphatase, partial [Kiloniellales bacterium]|nr:Ppx/GppA family phosphatase [Kiloniellales bacterium]